MNATNDNTPRLLSVRQVCEWLGLGKSKVYVLMESGELPYYQLGGVRRLSESDVLEWLSRQRCSA